MKRLLLLALVVLWSIPQWAASAVLTTNGSSCPGTTNTTAIVVNLPEDKGGATLTVAGTWTGTISFYGTGSGGINGGGIWTALSVLPIGSSTAVTSTTANGTWQVNVAGFTGVCMLSSASMTGSATVTITPSAASARSNGGSSSGGSGNANYTGTAGYIPQGSGTAHTLVDTNPILDNAVTTANTLTYAGTGGIAAASASLTGALITGTNGTYSGVDSLNGKTSGTAGWAVADAAGTAILYLLPTTNGTTGQLLEDTGSTTCGTYQSGLGIPTTCHQTAWETVSSGVAWDAITNPAGNMALSMGTKTSIFSGTAATSQFFAWKNTTAAVVGTSQGSPILANCGRGFHGSADVEDCLTLGELPGNGNDAAITFTLGHTGTSTGVVQLTFPGLSTAGGSTQNTVFGINATAGSAVSSTIIGYNAGHATLGGYYNTCIGDGACSNLSGSGYPDGLTAVGDGAGASDSTGSYNTFLGYSAGANGPFTGGNNILLFSGSTASSTPSSSTSNYLEISNSTGGIVMDMSKGILGFIGPTTTIANNACGSTTQGTLKSGSNDMVGAVTVGTATVTSCAVSFANTHNQAPFCQISPQSGSTVGLYHTESTTALTIAATSGIDSVVIDYICVFGSTTVTPTP